MGYQKVHSIIEFFFLAAKYGGRTSSWWLVANTPTRGSPSIFCSKKKEPCSIMPDPSLTLKISSDQIWVAGYFGQPLKYPDFTIFSSNFLYNSLKS
jgi:hypothetical protein